MRKTQKNNKAEFSGISWSKRTKRWQAKKGLKGSQYHLGYYESIDDARIAIMEWEDEMVEAGLIIRLPPTLST